MKIYVVPVNEANKKAKSRPMSDRRLNEQPSTSVDPTKKLPWSGSAGESAKESLIVCGHFQTLHTDETWQDLINDATSRDVAHVVTSVSSSDDLLRPLLMRPSPNVFTLFVDPVVQQQRWQRFPNNRG